jgi:hypothetical protein
MESFKIFAGALSLIFALATLAGGVWSVNEFNRVQDEANAILYECIDLTDGNRTSLSECSGFFNRSDAVIGNREATLEQSALKAAWEFKELEKREVQRAGVVLVGVQFTVWGAFHLAYLWGRHVWRTLNGLD